MDSKKNSKLFSPIDSCRYVVRTSKQDSVVLYHLLEAEEGLAHYSTLPESQGQSFRDVEVNIPPGRESEFEAFLQECEDFVTVIASPKV